MMSSVRKNPDIAVLRNFQPFEDLADEPGNAANPDHGLELPAGLEQTSFWLMKVEQL